MFGSPDIAHRVAVLIQFCLTHVAIILVNALGVEQVALCEATVVLKADRLLGFLLW